MSDDSSDELRQQITELGDRVRRLEQALSKLQPEPSAPTASPAHATAPAPGLASTPRPESVPRPSQPVHQQQRANTGVTDEREFEHQIGSHVFNRIGIVAVLIGMAWFLKFAFDNQWVGPVGRTIIGLMAGAGLIVWSERFRSRGYPAFSYSLKAVGSGVLYLSLWVAYDVYHLIPSGTAFLAMLLVTAWNGFMCWVQDSEALAWYAMVGGFLTPVLASTGGNHQLVLFSYVLGLDIVVLVLIALRPWSRLVLGAFAATVLLLDGWAERFYTDEVFVVTAIFVTAFVLLFALAPFVLRSLRDHLPGASLPEWDRGVLVLLPLANAGLGFGTLYAMLAEPGRRWGRPWVAVAFSAAYLLLLQRPLPALRRHVDQSNILAALHLTLAVTFAAIAIPLRAHGYWVAVGWLVQGGALMWGARRFAVLLLRALALGPLLLGVCVLLSMEPGGGAIVLNARFATYVVGVVVFGVVAWLAQDAENTPDRGTPFPELARVLSWRYIAGAAVVAVNVLTLIAVGLEIHAYWASWGQGWARAEQFSHSVWWMSYGALLLAAGFWKRSALLRWQALILLTLSIGKVFLVDMSALSEGYRILSFLGLGVLLLAVSFVYQRDWLGLRTPHPPRLPPVETSE